MQDCAGIVRELTVTVVLGVINVTVLCTWVLMDLFYYNKIAVCTVQVLSRLQGEPQERTVVVDIVGTVYHLAIYMQSNKIYKVF